MTDLIKGGQMVEKGGHKEGAILLANILFMGKPVICFFLFFKQTTSKIEYFENLDFFIWSSHHASRADVAHLNVL